MVDFQEKEGRKITWSTQEETPLKGTKNNTPTSWIFTTTSNMETTLMNTFPRDLEAET